MVECITCLLYVPVNGEGLLGSSRLGILRQLGPNGGFETCSSIFIFFALAFVCFSYVDIYICTTHTLCSASNTVYVF